VKKSDIFSVIISLEKESELRGFFKEILTPNEFKTIQLRWRLLKMLKAGRSQREIARKLKISLCKITRGSKILKNKRSVTGRII